MELDQKWTAQVKEASFRMGAASGYARNIMPQDAVFQKLASKLRVKPELLKAAYLEKKALHPLATLLMAGGGAMALPMAFHQLRRAMYGYEMPSTEMDPLHRDISNNALYNKGLQRNMGMMDAAFAPQQNMFQSPFQFGKMSALLAENEKRAQGFFPFGNTFGKRGPGPQTPSPTAQTQAMTPPPQPAATGGQATPAAAGAQRAASGAQAARGVAGAARGGGFLAGLGGMAGRALPWLGMGGLAMMAAPGIMRGLRGAWNGVWGNDYQMPDQQMDPMHRDMMNMAMYNKGLQRNMQMMNASFAPMPNMFANPWMQANGVGQGGMPLYAM